MLCRFDGATVKGLYSIAGFIELDHKTPEQTASLILERLALNEGKPKDDHYRRHCGTVASALAPPSRTTSPASNTSSGAKRN